MNAAKLMTRWATSGRGRGQFALRRGLSLVASQNAVDTEEWTYALQLSSSITSISPKQLAQHKSAKPAEDLPEAGSHSRN